MSRRRRGLLFAVLSALAALIAALAVGRHERALSSEEEVRAVVVAATEIEAGERIEPDGLRVRRLPASAIAPEAFEDPSAIAGSRAAIEIPAGAYLLPGLLGRPRRVPGSPGPAPGGATIEISVTGAAALRKGGAVGERVDVLVTRDSQRGLGGRTRIAVTGARLLDLDGGADQERARTATLALGRKDAIRLIEADSYAREIRLIGHR